MAEATLVMLLNDVRGKTLRLLDGVEKPRRGSRRRGCSIRVLWHAGHALVVNEQLGVAAATGRPAACPDGWIQMFGWQSQPATITQWPALADVMTELRAQQARLATAIQGLTTEQLDQALQNGTVRHSILHGLHDEACHQGEIWLVEKLWKMPRCRCCWAWLDHGNCLGWSLCRSDRKSGAGRRRSSISFKGTGGSRPRAAIREGSARYGTPLSSVIRGSNRAQAAIASSCPFFARDHPMY